MATPNQEVCSSLETKQESSKITTDLDIENESKGEKLCDQDSVSATRDENTSVNHTDSEHDTTRQANTTSPSSVETESIRVENSKSENEQNNKTDSVQSENAVNSAVMEKSEYLMKRTKISHKWENTYFLLKNTSLFYGNQPQDNTNKKNLKEIPLQGAEIAETEIDKKQNVISIKPKDTKRTFYIQTKDKEHLDDWLQALCYAKVGDNKDGNSEACVIQ